MHILIGLIAVTVLVFLMTRRNYLFVLSVKGGEVRLQRGKVPQKILHEFSQAVKPNMSGKIMGSKRGSAVTLSFDGNLDEFTQQRLRNIYGLHQR